MAFYVKTMYFKKTIILKIFSIIWLTCDTSNFYEFSPKNQLSWDLNFRAKIGEFGY